jgi:uncharacterized RDD family membrane protein YckC
MDLKKDYYKILGLNENAHVADIRAGYDFLSQKYNPDVFHGSKQFANDMMFEINEAYDVLSNDEERKKYDSLRVSETSSNAEHLEISPLHEHADTAQITEKKINLGAWRRMWARSLDFLVYQTIVVLFFLLFPALIFSNSSTLHTETVDSISIYLIFWLASVVVWCFAEAISFELFGNTLGKFILGLSLSKKSNKPSTFEDSLIRAFNVLVSGHGLLIPFVSIITMIISKLRLEDKGETSWDEELGFKINIQPISATRYALYIFIFLIVATIHMISVKSLENIKNPSRPYTSQTDDSTTHSIDELRRKFPNAASKRNDKELLEWFCKDLEVELNECANYYGVQLPDTPK